MIPGLSNDSLFLLIAITAGAAIGLFIVQRWIWPLVKSAVKKKPTKLTEERSADLVRKYMHELGKVEERRANSMSLPMLSVVRTGRKGDTVMCIITNRGGTAMNLSVEAEDEMAASVEPQTLLQKMQTARVMMRGVAPDRDTIRFQLYYDDSYGHRTRRTYAYNKFKSTFKEV